MKFVELSVGPVSVPAILAITVFSIMCLLYIRVGRAMWRQDSSTGVDLQWNKSSTARAQERSGIVLGGFSVTFLLVSIAIALFPDEKADSGVGFVAVAGGAVLVLVNLVLLGTTALFARPKFLIPPAFRSQGGLITDVWRWLRERRRGDAK